MSNHSNYESEMNQPHPGSSGGLARWLQELMLPPNAPAPSPSSPGEQLTLLQSHDDHLLLYQKIPDFCESLLKHDDQVYLRYAGLIYHLIGCSLCRSAYVETYAALGKTLGDQPRSPEQEALLRPPATVPPAPARSLVHLCQALIRQAELLLRQAEREPEREDALVAARQLLQRAIRLSAGLTQQREQALHDLVRVASLVTTSEGPPREPPLYAYELRQPGPVTRSVRRGALPLASASLSGQQATPAVILLQAGPYEGRIVQEGDLLVLFLQGLPPELHGQYLEAALPLGTLVEAVEWFGGNPQAIRSLETVDSQGRLRFPLGRTSLQLSRPEERNMLEVAFMRLELRPCQS
ncbi:MAG: hypothetical protein IMW90_21300 [Thermogemmatispora sp.]|uniref:hypothetical protein n=1 Tax=Thermogemmatispora sp. TaxID=1968838 RepID=UPI0019E84F38|nr:hypothetical protein [Thermogemmatispora sp.]MBE3568263.1 hypothetical protein [Thermogemmatispora sp.]